MNLANQELLYAAIIEKIATRRFKPSPTHKQDGGTNTDFLASGA
jgi:hypothetical protein